MKVKKIYVQKEAIIDMCINAVIEVCPKLKIILLQTRRTPHTKLTPLSLDFFLTLSV